MPYLKINTNIEIADPQKKHLLGELSRLTANLTGKPERYVMIELHDKQNMLFAGSSDPLAYLECKSIGLSAIQARNLSAGLSSSLTSSLALAADRIYIEFSNCPAEFWGWNGSTFA